MRLMECARSGNSAALRELLDVYRPYLRLLARRKGDDYPGGLENALSAVEKTVRAAREEFAEFRGQTEDELVIWLADRHELALMSAIFETPAPGDHAGNDPGGERVSLATICQPMVSPLRRKLRSERAAVLATVLETLPPDQYEAVRLRHVEGWALGDIAARFRCAETAVAERLLRGLRRMKTRLNEF